MPAAELPLHALDFQDQSLVDAEVAELCQIARCPITRLSLRPATMSELAAANINAQNGHLWHRDGTPVRSGIEAGFVSQDHQFLYLFKDGVAFLMAGYAIDLLQAEQAQQASVLRAEKQILQSFYDEIGWVSGSSGEFEDALIYEDLRPISASYISKCHRRVMRFLAPSGKYFLDAASGPVQYKEYVLYSDGYHRRVCVDLSFRALTEARRKLGRKGLYVLGDITNLPFIDQSMDGFVSLHTIYHVPADEQRNAFAELFRVLGTEKSGVVVYYQHAGPLARLMMGPASVLRKLRNSLVRAKPPRQKPTGDQSATDGAKSPPRAAWPYCYAHPRKWFTSQAWDFPLEIRAWRTLGVPAMRFWIRPVLLGRPVLAALFRLENLFPRLLGRLGEYPMFVVRRK